MAKIASCQSPVTAADANADGAAAVLSLILALIPLRNEACLPAGRHLLRSHKPTHLRTDTDALQCILTNGMVVLLAVASQTL